MEARWDCCSLKTTTANVGGTVVGLDNRRGERCAATTVVKRETVVGSRDAQSIPRRTLCECSSPQS